MDAEGLRTCACTSSHQLWCWDGPGHGRPSQLRGMACDDVVVGADAVCVLSGTSVQCSEQSSGEWLPIESPPDLPPALALTLGFDHTCILSTAGEPHCWGGMDMYSQVSGATGHEAELGGAVDIVAGPMDTCVRVGGRAWCWGGTPIAEDDPGLGAASGPRGSSPYVRRHGAREVPTAQDVALLAVGRARICLVTSDRAMTCLGYDRPPPQHRFAAHEAIATDVDALDMSALSGCLLRAGSEIWCWGPSPVDRAQPPGLRMACIVDGRPVEC